MSQKLSKQGLPICPEVCKACEDGTHAMHILNELANLYVTIHTYIRPSDGKEIKHYLINGYAECDADAEVYPNMWLKDLLIYAGHLLEREKK